MITVASIFVYVVVFSDYQAVEVEDKITVSNMSLCIIYALYMYVTRENACIQYL